MVIWLRLASNFLTSFALSLKYFNFETDQGYLRKSSRILFRMIYLLERAHCGGACVLIYQIVTLSNYSIFYWQSINPLSCLLTHSRIRIRKYNGAIVASSSRGDVLLTMVTWTWPGACLPAKVFENDRKHWGRTRGCGNRKPRSPSRPEDDPKDHAEAIEFV